MNLYGKESRTGSIIINKVCNLNFHPKVWGFCILVGQKALGLGLDEHYDLFLEITFLCWTFEIIKETFIDEDGLVGNDRNVV